MMTNTTPSDSSKTLHPKMKQYPIEKASKFYLERYSRPNRLNPLTLVRVIHEKPRSQNRVRRQYASKDKHKTQRTRSPVIRNNAIKTLSRLKAPAPIIVKHRTNLAIFEIHLSFFHSFPLHSVPSSIKSSANCNRSQIFAEARLSTLIDSAN